jgi:hypothetical protein
MLALGALCSTADAQGDSIFFITPCVNGLQVDINGGVYAATGYTVSYISWSWGDGMVTPSGWFAQSHIYSSAGTYTVKATAYYTDGTTQSASQSVTVGPGILTNCVALTITAGQNGSISYQASVGSGIVAAGSSTTLELAYTNGASLTAIPAAGFAFLSWLVSAGITGLNGIPINTTSPSINTVVSSNSTIAATFAASSIPKVFVSTGQSGQILAVDGSSGATSVLYTPPGDSPTYDFEGLAVGPDNLIYITDPDDHDIFRLPQTTRGTLQTVYQSSCGEEGPCSAPDQVQGPSFSTTGLLTFNTEDREGVWQISFNSSDNPSAPVQLIPPAYGAVTGAGTAFNLLDELLIVDQSSWDVLEQTAPGATTTSTLISNTEENNYLYWPVGIAVNSSGNIFVANWNNCVDCQFSNPGYIAEFDSNGNFLSYYATFSCFGEEGGGPCDAPTYMQFDASGNLYVVTVQDETYIGGKVWRLPPPVPPATTSTPHLLVDLNALYEGENAIGLLASTAVGLALSTTTYTTPPQPITPGTPMTFTDGNIVNQTITIPTGSSLGGAASIAVNFQQWNPSVFYSTRLTNTTPNPWSGGTPVQPGTACTTLAGNNGNCIVIEDLCFDSNGNPIVPCQIFAPSGQLINLLSKYQTQSAQPNPGLIIADDGANDWNDITIGFSPNDPVLRGGTKGLNTDTSIVNLGVPVVSPASLEIGTVYVGTTTAKSVTVTNTMGTPMTISDPLLSVLSGGNSKAYVAVNLCPKTLAVGANCTIEVAFLAGPFYNSPQTAILSVVDSAPSSPQEVFLSATVINPQAWLIPFSLSFGKQPVGSKTVEAVTLKNTGATPLTIFNITTAGKNSADFLPSSTCPISPATLPAGSSCTITVTFTPSVTGSESAKVVITDNALFSPQFVLLSGTGY